MSDTRADHQTPQTPHTSQPPPALGRTLGFTEAQQAAAAVRARLAAAGVTEPPACAFVLGSGLGGLAAHVQDAVRISYADIPHMPRGRVVGHAGELIRGRLGALPVVMLSGRAHYYEGFSMSEVVFGVRMCRLLGAETLVLTNAAGGLNMDLRPGNLMLIRDQIHLFVGDNPLRGANDERFGTRFPDMTDLYTRELRQMLRDVASDQSFDLRSGIYVCVPGPSYETPAEVRMLRSLGADAVGMSTTAEAIAARHAGMSVLGISCITNLGAGLGSGELSHDEVKEVADLAGGALQKLALGFAERLAARGRRVAS